MKTKKAPKKLSDLMLSIGQEYDRRRASAVRHIKATTRGTPPGGRRDRVSVVATDKAREAVMWLDSGFVGTPDYMGLAWFWHYEYRHSLRDATPARRRRVHAAFLGAGLPVDGYSPEHEEIVRKEAR
jgi:hypothetical protein